MLKTKTETSSLKSLLAAGAGILLAAAVARPAEAAQKGPTGKPPPNVLWKHYMALSSATGKIERFWVGHAASLKADGQYPVIYFLDGLLGNEHEWKKAVDSHLAKQELIAVCPSVGGATWFMNSPAQPWMKWGDFLTRELRAFVETNYPASREKGQRGIAGISSGAHGALYHALRNPDLYGSVSLLSGALDLAGYAGTVGLDYWVGPRTSAVLPVYTDRSALLLAKRHPGPWLFDLYLDVGDKDGAKPQMDALRRILDSRRVPFRWHVGTGAHNWTYWHARAGDHLAWHASLFAGNRREGRYTQEAPTPNAPPLELLDSLPDVTLSDDAVARLRAPWSEPHTGESIRVSGVSEEGGPLAKKDDLYKEVTLRAPLTARGHTSGLYLYRLTLTVSTPMPRAGEITMNCRIQNGRGMSVCTLPPTALPVPAGEPNRRAGLRARLALELKGPDPLRGGIVCGLQVFDVDGRPLGDPAIGKAKPGSTSIELWPIAPAARAQWTLSLKGTKALPLAAVHQARLETETSEASD